MIFANALRRFLATGGIETGDESLAEHDRRHHPDGYREGDSCKYRDSLAKGDDADRIGRGDDGDSTQISDEAREKVLDVVSYWLGMLGTELGEDYPAVGHREICGTRWNGNRFSVSLTGLSDNDCKSLSKFAVEATAGGRSELERRANGKALDVEGCRVRFERYRTDETYRRDWPPMNIRKGDPVRCYRATLTGTVSADFSAEKAENYGKTLKLIDGMAETALKGSQRYCASLVSGKAAGEGGRPYEVIGIRDKNTGLIEKAYRVGGARNDKALVHDSTASGWHEIDVAAIPDDIRRFYSI